MDAGLNSDVTVVIVTYNSAHCITRLAEGLQQHDAIIFVDNASSDDTVTQIKQHLPQAMIVEQSKNKGFGAANNAALACVTTPYALLLNPDCVIHSTDIEQLRLCAQQYPESAMIAPQLINDKGVPSINYSWIKHAWKSRGAGADGDCCVGFVTGAVMLLLMENTRDLGYFDESFFLYYEDDDLCNKYFAAKKNIIVAPHIQIEHSSRGSVKTNNVVKQEFWRGFHHAQSKVLIAHKYQGESAARKTRIKTFWSGLVMTVLRILTLNPRMAGRMAGRMMGMLQMSAKLRQMSAKLRQMNE